MIFVNSMSDLFHADVPTEYILKVMDVMRLAHWHTFQVLTKRAGRMSLFSSVFENLPNVWAGVSVESHAYLSRIRDLEVTKAAVKFVSFEPLLSWVNSADLTGIDWAIVGGESGPHCRPFDPNWARDILLECCGTGTAFFMKQLGGHPDKRDKLDDLPVDLRIREYPST